MVARQAKQPAAGVLDPVDVDAAIELVAAGARRAASEPVDLLQAVDRVLAADLSSLADVPNCDVSAMDGYACRASDTASAHEASPASLRIVGESAAGRPYAGVVGRGEAVAIYTGAPLPEGADAIVRIEDIQRSGPTVFVGTPARSTDVRTRGDQVAAGTTCLRAGTLLTPRAILLAAAMGHRALPVAKRPRVVIVVTGDEVVEPGASLAQGQVFNANGPAVSALVAHFGGTVVEARRAPDDRAALARYLAERSEDAELIVTTGGASVGRYDLVHSLLTDDPRGTAAFTRVHVRPGGPVSFGSYAGLPLLALPGNPAAAAVMFQVLGAVWFRQFLGSGEPAPYLARRPARAARPFRHAKHKTGFWPARLARRGPDGVPLIEPLEAGHGDGPAQLQRATCLAITEPWQEVPVGGRIEMMELV